MHQPEEECGALEDVMEQEEEEEEEVVEDETKHEVETRCRRITGDHGHGELASR